MKQGDITVFSGKTMKRKQGFFSISAVAKMFSIHQQTIRLYEREGLINPKRSGGNTRLFSEEDVNRLEEVIYLTHKLGVNLSGVQMILKLQKQIKKMQKEVNAVFDETRRDLVNEQNEKKLQADDAALKLAKLKSKSSILTTQNSVQPTMVDDNWEIEYDE